jgi:molybdate transport repressor ModE-like protein
MEPVLPEGLAFDPGHGKVGFVILERHVGGISGGGSKITLSAQEFMKQYDMFRSEASRALEEIYGKYFDVTE